MTKKDEKGQIAREPAPGNVILRAPDGATACSVDTVEYKVEDGLVEVQERHAQKLVDHGFTR